MGFDVHFQRHHLGFSYKTVSILIFVMALLGTFIAESKELDSPSSFCRCQYVVQSSSKKNSGQLLPPWEAVILRRMKDAQQDTPSKICSGSIINEKIILTSVTCAKKDRLVGIPLDEVKRQNLPKLEEKDIRKELTTENLEVWIGIHNESYLNGSGEQMLEVEQIIPHPNVTEKFGTIPDWDFAIIVLKNKIDFSTIPNLSPVCMLPGIKQVDLSGQPVGSHFWRFIPPTYDVISLRVEPTQVLTSLTTSQLFPNQQCKSKALKSEWISDRYICTAEGLQTNSGSGQIIQLSSGVPVIAGLGSYQSLYGTPGKQDFKQIALISKLSDGQSFIQDVLDKFGLSICQVGAEELKVPPMGYNPESLDDTEPFDFKRRPWLQFTSEYRRIFPPDAGCRCGLAKQAPVEKPPTLDKYIWRGQDFDTDYQYNWHGNLGIYSYLKVLSCGGSVINDKLILTAAHCVTVLNDITRQKKIHYKLRGKDSYAEYAANDSYAIYSTVDSTGLLVHPDYLRRKIMKRDGKTYDYVFSSYDISLLVRNETLDLRNTPDLGTSCLPFSGETLKLTGNIATVIGNGFWHKKNAPSGIPQQLHLEIDDLNRCRKQWWSWHIMYQVMPKSPFGRTFVHLLADSVLCNGMASHKRENYTGTYHGDSGSSVFIDAQSNGSEQQKIQIGLVSGGLGFYDYETAEGYNLTLPEDDGVTKLMAGVVDHETLSYIDYASFYLNASWCSR